MEIMKTKTTLDYKILLSQWKVFQTQKVIAKNMFPCRVDGRQATMSLINEGEHRIEIRHSRSWVINFLLNEIRGYNTQGNTITVTLIEPPHLIIEFNNEATHAAALVALENFVREEVSEQTPPSLVSN